MRFELDENLGRRTAALFREAGHDVSTIAEQDMSGATDDAAARWLVHLTHQRISGRLRVVTAGRVRQYEP